jgi:hemerythrin-like metal-binding protein
MIKIEWTDELSVGHEMIDKQHMILVRAINLLALGAEREVDSQLMDAIFSTLADYTQVHFTYEEEVFDAAGFPFEESQKHKQTHQQFLQKAVELKSQWDASHEDISHQVLSFLVDWLRNHILGSDKEYMPYIHGQSGEQMKKAG